MDSKFDAARQQQAEAFQQQLAALTDYYQRQAFLAGFTRARRDWEAIQERSQQKPRRRTSRAKRLARVLARISLGLYVLLQTNGAEPAHIARGVLRYTIFTK